MYNKIIQFFADKIKDIFDRLERVENSAWEVDHIQHLMEPYIGIGAMVFTPTNDPPTADGWELVDKYFAKKNIILDSDNMFFIPDRTAISNMSGYARITNENIHMRLNIETMAGITDTATTLGTFNLGVLGMTGTPWNEYITAYSDDGNGVAFMDVSNGSLRTVDSMARGGGQITSSCTLLIDFVWTVATAHKLDSACDKFLWIRRG